MSAYIAGRGIVSALGCGLPETVERLKEARCALEPLRLFAVPMHPPLPAGVVNLSDACQDLPRTHRLARLAAEQALAGTAQPPDAIVVGTTTGGIFTTETLLERNCDQADAFRFHGLGSVAEELARQFGCTGPVITVSTACSSGAVAIKLALEMLRSGQATRILAGGVDGLSRLTYFGFHSLQLIDDDGARPLDLNRRGMSVAEGAGFLLLTAPTENTPGLRLLGAGLSCDAHHATSPHPQGAGALAAMQAALSDAGLVMDDVDYINLHGTGTTDNDLAEARAIRTLFQAGPPPLSSTKGATGHTLAAAGAIEAVIACSAIEQSLVPANVGFQQADPELDLVPVKVPEQMAVQTVLSNSFGFGGNNAALLIGRQERPATASPETAVPPMVITGCACLTGAGRTEGTLSAFMEGKACNGLLEDAQLRRELPPRIIRRLKRLPTMTLALASDACRGRADDRLPRMVSMGTAWGALSETHDFLQRLNETQMQFPSPIDFVGSVHNAPAGQIAMMLGAKGANITTSGGDYSFEQALLSADLLTRQTADPVLVVGADEYHGRFSPLFDASVRTADRPADGGGALIIQRGGSASGPTIDLAHYQASGGPDDVAALLAGLGGPKVIRESFGLIMVGIPAGNRPAAEAQLDRFVLESRFEGAIIDYRAIVGEFATASAAAAALAVELLGRGNIPGSLNGGTELPLDGRGALLLGLGAYTTAIRILPQ